jgi:hypothetical protein
MRKRALMLVAGASFLGVSGGALAQAPAPVDPHQHFLLLPDGSQLPVGPDICGNPASDQGFYGFHQNVHTGTPNQSAFQKPNNPVGFRAIRECPPE